MKTTATGFPINRNGRVINSLTNEYVLADFRGKSFKEEGTYYFFRFKRNSFFICTP